MDSRSGRRQFPSGGISIHPDFSPGDLGQLVCIHGVQNFSDYGFNHVHEAYCAQIAVGFILSPEKSDLIWT
jgi:hypothetical protein